MGRDAAQTEDGRYRLLVEAVTDYAIWVLILMVSHNLGLCISSRCGIGMRQIGPQIDFFLVLFQSWRLCPGAALADYLDDIPSHSPY